MRNENNRSLQWHEKALAVIPGGVSSPVRAFSAVGGIPKYFVKGKGATLIDVDGNEYVDLVGSWGPMIAGHAHPSVVEKVKSAVENSSSFGAPTPNEVLLAQEIITRVSAVEKVRFVSSGTEAVMTAIRMARAATDRKKIIKFSGCYHGHVDSLLVQSGSGVITLGLPNSPGVTSGQAEDTIVLPYNDFEKLEEVFVTEGQSIAAVITEAAAANMGVVPPLTGFNKKIYDLCQANQALMILDEVMTGFRVSSGGWWGRFGENENWKPDLFTFGKVIGGGYPLAAVGGQKRYMDLLAPIGNVYQAGTLSGNPIATTAGLATLELCDDALYKKINNHAESIQRILSDKFTEASIPHVVQNAGNLFSIFFTPDPVLSFDDAKKQDTKTFAKFFHNMLENGVYLPPSAFEAWFVSAAHTDFDLEKIENAVKNSLKNI
jgi:glutamate-1-semialdehyde 2,1-aminomutase